MLCDGMQQTGRQAGEARTIVPNTCFVRGAAKAVGSAVQIASTWSARNAGRAQWAIPKPSSVGAGPGLPLAGSIGDQERERERERRGSREGSPLDWGVTRSKIICKKKRTEDQQRSLKLQPAKLRVGQGSGSELGYA